MVRFAIPLLVAATVVAGCGRSATAVSAPSEPRVRQAVAIQAAMAAEGDVPAPAFAVPLSGGRPVVLVPGYLDASWYFTLIDQRVRGMRRSTHMLALFPNISDITVAAKRLAAHVEKVKRETGYDQVDIVAHSEGGLIARQSVKVEVKWVEHATILTNKAVWSHIAAGLSR